MKRRRTIFLVITLICVMLTASYVISVNGIESDATGDVDTNVPISANTLLGVPSYTVTIPAEIDLGDITQTAASNYAYTDFNISVSNVSLLNNKEIKVMLVGSGTSGTFTLADTSGTGNTLTYELKTGEDYVTNIQKGMSFGAFEEAGGSVSCRLCVDTSLINKASSYSGYIKFVFDATEKTES